jgi:hypothetical protein
MIVFKLLAAMWALNAATAQAQPLLFYSAKVANGEIVSLLLTTTKPALDRRFDFDVQIAIDHAGVYFDPSTHKATIRCGMPGEVLVGGVEYPMTRLASADWKLALWNAICSTPTS